MNIRDQVERLSTEHGVDLVLKALQFLPRLIALIKAGKARRITTALDAAHAEIDARESELSAQYRAKHPSDGHQ